MSTQLRRSRLGMRLKKLELQMTDERGLVPQTNAWRVYWTAWMQKFVNGENPPGRIPEEAVRTLMDEIEIPPYQYPDE